MGLIWSSEPPQEQEPITVTIACIWENVRPWVLPRRRLVQMVQTNEHVIETMSHDLEIMAEHHEELHAQVAAMNAENERLRERLAATK